MIIIGEVRAIFSAREKTKSILRPTAVSLNLIEGHGIENDRYAGKNISRSVMIVGQKAYEIAKKNNISLQYGSFGENILTDFDPHEFIEGTIFCIGDAKLQVTETCSICGHLASYDKRLPELVQYHRGVYCKILDGGKIIKGQTINL